MKTFGIISLGVLTIIILIVLFFTIITLIVLFFTIKTCSIAEKHITNSMENAVISYDEYENMYATCKQLNSDLGVIKDTPNKDAQFVQFSKAQRINALKQQLNRWIGEYNAKSKHIDKKWWKSSDLPYSLTSSQFSNY